MQFLSRSEWVQVVLCYEPPGRPAEDRRVHPHGLVCKRGVWYLVATTSGED
ncbi:MAG: WYL domain-containing protein [Actinomycetota bacterium]|nr:WYL domain-containing protein [Actinomycetota bacterium]